MPQCWTIAADLHLAAAVHGRKGRVQVRELYAAELRGDAPETNETASRLIHEWAARHVAVEGVGDAGADAVTEEATASGAELVVIDQRDQNDPTLRWRSEVAIGAPTERLFVTVRIRLGSTGGGPLAPIEYEFGTPAIVRTLLRECHVSDAGQRCLPSWTELGQSDVPLLVEWIERPERRLPVVVVSRTRDTGAVLVDVNSLSKELAGVAHVRVLAAQQAAWALTEAVGAPRSVWDGAIRVYFPRYSSDDNPRRHRLWPRDRVDNGLVTGLRAWLGALASSCTPEHPVHQELRHERRAKLHEAAQGADPALLTEYIDFIDETLKQREAEVAELLARNVELQRQAEATESELEDVRRSFGDLMRAQASSSSLEREADGPPATVAAAMDAVEELASSAFYQGRVEITAQAIRGGREFTTYYSPAELLRAVQAVMEASQLWSENKLGEPPATFFARRGFGYGTLPQPHLKVDEATRPDQCLRIYWTVDEERRRYVISEIGRHQ